MVLLEAARFTMGSDRFYREETPAHERAVDAFWIDTHPVTNRQFAAFIMDTGHVTVAERPAPGPDGDQPPGSLVFTPTAGPVSLSDWRQWWRWVPGASWREPQGPGSNLEGLDDHPVTHVAFDDASAYARWAGKRLPTEVEHEYASGGGATSSYAWGDDPHRNGQLMANWWQGNFPYENTGRWTGTSPVGSFPANVHGLFDTIGNVWEWTSDVFAIHGEQLQTRGLPLHSSSLPRVLKGGSFLCTPQYCLRFRPSARSSQTPDSSTSHIGFRCAMTPTGKAT